MKLRLIQSALVVLIPAVLLLLVWFFDEEVSKRRRAWLESHLPAWVWEVPSILAVVLGLASLAVLVVGGLVAWGRWVLYG